MNGRSNRLFKEARQAIPGGVNSPVRAFGSVGMEPRYIQRGKGSRIYDVDGNEYIDYVCSWGPLILGHADERVVRVLCKAAANGTSFGANTSIEVKFAELIARIYPSIDLVRRVPAVLKGLGKLFMAIRLGR